MLLPGPEAQQLAAYIGWRLHGIRGGIVAGAFFVIPSVFFLLILSYIYAAHGNLPQINAVLYGFKAVVVAIVVEAVFKIAKKAFKSYWHALISILSFTAIYFFHIPFPLIILSAAIIGIVSPKFQAQNPKSKETPAVKTSKTATNRFYFLKVLSVCFGLWLLPFIVLLVLSGFDNLLTKTYLFFTQSAFLTFGGAYAVLAYVNQAVVSAGWITTAQSADGLALAETTPGPLIMVLQFVGFMIGWNNPGFSNQIFSAIVFGLLTTYATFLPSFFFIFAGAPYIEKLRHNTKLNAALSGVTAAVVGVILNLALTFGATVVFPNSQIDFFAMLLAIAAFIALYFLKTNVLIVVICGGICGLISYFI
jgi:chromate transporter